MEEWRVEAEKLAEQGLTPYQIQLGNSYLRGRDPDGNVFPQDFVEARKWLERAHLKGAFTATYILGTMYENGKGVPPNIEKAIELYEAAASRGAFYPCVDMARIYASGAKLQKSEELAAKWYAKVLTYETEVDDVEAMNEARQYLDAHRSEDR